MDWPYDLYMATNHALTVISWHENLPTEEQPPRHIWWSEEKLAEWFEEVKAARGTGNRRRKSLYDQADDVPMTENDLAAEYRQAMLSSD